MQLGLMTHHLTRPTIEAVAQAVADYGLSAVQLNLESAGLEPLPATFDAGHCRQIADAFARHGIAIAAVSGTFNMIDPDRQRLDDNVARFDTVLEWCRGLDCDVVTACTGTRHPSNMWRHHPANAEPEAWTDLRATLRRILPKAEQAGVTVSFEPEVVNVVDTAEKAQRLIEEAGSDRLRLVMDPANYFHPDMLPNMAAVLDDVFARVGRYVVFAHAKDVRGPSPGGSECVRPAAGTGILDYPRYLRLLRASGYDGALVMHSLAEHEVPTSGAYVRRFMDGTVAESPARRGRWIAEG